jgi:hypothetical protein
MRALTPDETDVLRGLAMPGDQVVYGLTFEVTELVQVLERLVQRGCVSTSWVPHHEALSGQARCYDITNLGRLALRVSRFEVLA